ncbi:L-threonylcarbamoyladenylate synthase [Parenemella sanctibonifatiensis]|uniref:L-threonylcarbamoyladenylate synthase n=1 Tax=Parenemella sanctibonifatiensis TaxID=2016505 RepID=UPI0015C60A4C|nr:L-threonylcarbamoyladenylate synthase [Parenemella sanctibonifatiensis]
MSEQHDAEPLDATSPTAGEVTTEVEQAQPESATEPVVDAEGEPGGSEETAEESASEVTADVADADAEPEPDPEPVVEIIDAVTDPEGGIARAAELLAEGHVVVIPTDTVYGVAADAFNRKAVNALLEAKGRGRDKPPPVLISDAPMLQALGDKVPSYARKLVDKYWPGPMTVVVKAQDGLRMELGETKGTIGLRVPDHDLTRSLLRRTGALAVSSANRTEQPPAHSVAEAVEQLEGHVSYFLDAGPVADGPSSTMVNFSSGHYGELLRLGPHSLAELQETCPFLKDPMGLAPEPEPEPADETDADDATTEAEATDAEATTDTTTDSGAEAEAEPVAPPPGYSPN